ncbi:hypothetical protein [Sphingobacterium faecium]|uniref:hypothetical protein n=1 Tax=Sphingobacterium faecium TaxID=34087 RepID=UPI00320BADA9
MNHNTALFDTDYKDIQLNSGFARNGITIHAKEWSVAYVKDAVTGELLSDKEENPAVLATVGEVELWGRWLKLEKSDENNLLTMSLTENFNRIPRKFLIGIVADGKQDELSFTQNRGETYEIVKKEIIEVPGSRKEYNSNEGCYTITLNNNTSTAKNMETTSIFKDVTYMSEFTSDDQEAFSWMNSPDSLIFMGEILKDGVTYWSKQVPYKKGQYLESYMNEGSKQELLVEPYTTINVRGEISYLTRECLYTFTIKNMSSGYVFDISGVWKQKVPLSSMTKIF